MSNVSRRSMATFGRSSKKWSSEAALILGQEALEVMKEDPIEEKTPSIA
jgi:hypothetical protein